MNKNAVMPLSDYISACDKIREKTETTGTIVSGEWANKVDEVYEAGVEAGKAQGGAGGFSLNGTFILKEPITPEDLIVDYLEETFPAESVYAYFYDNRINDYVYLPVEWLYHTEDYFDWNTTDGDTSHTKRLQDGKWGYSWYIDGTEESGDGLYPDIKGRIIVFTKPTVVSENFYNLFMATTNGAEENFDEGKQAEVVKRWNEYTANNTRTNFDYAFYGSGWNDETFNPPFDTIKVGRAGYMFKDCLIAKSAHLKKLDFASCINFIQTFMQSQIEELGIIDTSNAGAGFGGLNQTFIYCSNLKKIEKVILPKTSVSIDGFGYCNSLTEIRFDGTAASSFNLQWSTALSKESITNIINALSDSTSGLTVTLSKKAVQFAFDDGAPPMAGQDSDEWKALVATKPNWTINLA